MSRKVIKQKTVEELLEGALIAKEEQPYDVPENWVWCYAGALSDVIRGVSYKKNQVENYKDSKNTLIIRGGNIQEGEIVNQKDNVYLNNELIKEDQKLKKGDVVIVSSTGSSKVIGKAAGVNEGFIGESFGAFITTVRPNPKIYYGYFNLFYQSSNYRITISSLAKGSNIKNIKKEHLDKLSFPLPPINEQKRITDKVERLLNKIDEAKQLIDEAKESFELRRAAILDKAFRGEFTTEWRQKNPNYFFSEDSVEDIQLERERTFEEEKVLAKIENRKIKYNKPTFLGEVDQTNLPNIPNTWRYVYLGNITEVVRGGSPRPAGDPRFFGGDIPWITVAEITKDDNVYLDSVSSFVTEEGMKRSRFIEEGTLLLSNSGATLGVPKVTKIAGCINDGSVAFVEVFQLSKLYLYYFLYSQTKRLRSLNQGAAQPNLNTDIVKHIVVPLPPIEEQIKIVDVLEHAIKLEKTSYALIEIENKVNEIKQSILSKAFHGELGTNDSTEESAIELLKEVL